MANPNIVGVSVIYGNTAPLAVSTTNTAIVSNPSSSNSVYKLNVLSVSNINTAAAAVSVMFNRGGSNTYLIQNIPVSANSKLDIIGKDTMLYLLENDSVQLVASANSYIQAIASWEQIS
jgi:hypothetical protein